MSDLDIEKIIVVVRYKDRIRWFRSDRDLWVLDVNKWRDEFVNHGYEIPDFKDSYRFGISVINQDTVQQFLGHISEDEIHKDDLSIELLSRYTTAESWWDVKDLFPIMFVNFDACKVGAFYSEGTSMERYVPDNWTGEFIDFANDYAEIIFPKEEKFWVKGDSDLLELLNKRGAEH